MLDIKERFRGYLPVVIDIETAGFHANTDALLEIAAVILNFDEDGILKPVHTCHEHIQPFEGAHLSPEALAFNGIDPFNPLRGALPELEGIKRIFQPIRTLLKETKCNRAILIGHNAHFDLGFLNAAVERQGIKRNPFHPFSCLDTATLGAVFYGHTVLAKICQLGEISFDAKEAHSALYDATKTAELFCKMVNHYDQLKAANALKIE